MTDEKFTRLLSWIRRIINFALVQFDREFPHIKRDKD
jgi:hypothetical protein